MRKIQLALMCLFTLLVATSCGSDSKEPSSPNEPTNFKLSYKVNVTKDLADYATVTVTYFDEDGNKQDDQITSTTWTKEVNVSKFPAKAGLKLNIERNTTALTKNSFKAYISYVCNLTYNVGTVAKEALVFYQGITGNEISGFDSESAESVVAEYIKPLNGSSAACNVTFDETTKVTPFTF